MPEAAVAEEILNLTRDFPAVSTESWEAAIAKDLKGADYEKKLVWRTEEGLGIRPYYRKEALAGLDAQLQTIAARAADGKSRRTPNRVLKPYGRTCSTKPERMPYRSWATRSPPA
jgi:hypothetical protein